MKKMQCPLPKFIAVILPVFFLFPNLGLSQISNYRLQQADSLFAAKQYTQSLEHYEKIFAQNQFSPSMLLKMAFIEEGLHRVGESMYYLNLYHQLTGDEMALEKIQQLSARFKLVGYDDPETENALTYYRQYEWYVSIALAAIMLLIFSVLVYQRRRKRPVVAFILVMLVSVMLFTHVTISGTDDKAIVAKGNTYLMEGPSGAAPVVEVIAPGHRVSVIRKTDVWVEVEWRNKRAFIRQDRLLPILL